MKLLKPLDIMFVTQGFGVNYVRPGFYAQFGYTSDKHNGLDLRARDGTPLYSCFESCKVVSIRYSRFAGWVIELSNPEGYIGIYCHCKENSFTVKAGDVLAQRQIIGESDTSGDAVIGAHLHFSLYPPTRNLANGYLGAIDPTPYFEPNYDKLPVDLKYGKPKNYWAEFKLRFKNSWLHRQLISRGRKPLSLTDRELNALIYGNWDFHTVMDETKAQLWWFLTKQEWSEGKQPPIPMGNIG